MTRPQQVRIHADDAFVGIHFRHALAGCALPLPVGQITDQMRPRPPPRLSAPAGCPQKSHAGHPDELLALVKEFLEPVGPETRVQRALDLQVAHHGTRPLTEPCEVTGLVPRQFRHVCLDRTGLTPKLFGRTLCFRQAAAAFKNNSHPDLATLALDGGYSNQAHLTYKFRVVAGASPTRHRRSRAA